MGKIGDIKGRIYNNEKQAMKILQFGEGNFLRGFVDEMIDITNEKGYMNADVIIVKPREGKLAEAFERQNCNYTVSLRSRDNVEDRIVSCVLKAYSCYEDYESFMALAEDENLRIIVSNTTEAGIVYDANDKFLSCPPASFPGKLAKFLYKRFKKFGTDLEKGVIILPVELIDDNGEKLKECILKLAAKWNLEAGFSAWINEACIFCSTLVDRIISGYPSEEDQSLWREWGYKDELIVTGEGYGLWIIESERDISRDFPLQDAGMPVVYVKDIKPYKKRKVRILNGAHTSFVPISILMGYETVLEAVSDKVIEEFVIGLLKEEIIPTIDLDVKESEEFADSVLIRFKNPYIRHELSAIALNSISKWKTRCLPAMLDYIDLFGKLPDRMVFSLAALLRYYRGKRNLNGQYEGFGDYTDERTAYVIQDEKTVTDIFEKTSKLKTDEYVRSILSDKRIWGMDLNEIDGLSERVTSNIKNISKNARETMSAICTK